MADKPKRTHKHEAIEPTLMQVPQMDRPSVALAWFLDSMIVEEDTLEESGLVMACRLCGESLFGVEHGDTLRVLFNGALAHTCVR